MTASRALQLSRTEPVLPSRVAAVGTQRAILEVSLSMFAARGYHAVSMREIGRGTGLSVSSIYGHFVTKEAILAALVVAGLTEHHERLAHAVAQAGPEPVAAIRALVTAHVEVHLELPTLARVAHRDVGALNEPHLGEVLALHRASTELFVSLVERGLRSGSFRVEDAQLAVAAIGAMGVKLADWWDVTAGPSPEVVVRNYVAFALRLLGTADSEHLA